MKIQSTLIMAAAVLAIAGCDGAKESSLYVPGYTGVGGTFPESEDGTEVAVAPESGEETAGASGGSADDTDSDGVTAPPPSLPDGDVFGRAESPLFHFRLDYGRYLDRYFEPIAMPAPTRLFQLTNLTWIHLVDRIGGKSQTLGCFDRETSPAGVLIGFSGIYDDASGDLIGFEKSCGEALPESGLVSETNPDIRLTAEHCPEGSVLFGAVLRYDPASRGFTMTDIGCALPAWVPVNE